MTELLDDHAELLDALIRDAKKLAHARRAAKPRSARGPWKELAQAIFGRVNGTAGAEADVFESLGRLARAPERDVVARAVCAHVSLEPSPRVPLYSDKIGRTHPWIRVDVGLAQPIAFGRVLCALGLTEEGRDLAFEAYAAARALGETLRGTEMFATFLRDLRIAITERRPYALLGFTDLQEWIDADVQMLASAPSARLEPVRRGAYAALAAS
ncbi:MAG: hypothetical protein IT378_17030 [Sandaracinaceae bacterium]|nr:hypothetical protein [Sandaracinaceae bacterium]